MKKVINLIVKDKNGFSLLELVVVICILVILTTILLPTVTGVIDDAKAGKHSGSANIIYSSTNVAVTSVAVAGFNGEERLRHLSADRDDSYSIAHFLDSTFLEPSDSSLTVWLDEEKLHVICIDYFIEGKHYIDPKIYAVNDDPKAKQKGISIEPISESNPMLEEGAVSIVISRD